MNGIIIIIVFILIKLLDDILFQGNEIEDDSKINKLYVPNKYLVLYIWFSIFSLLVYILLKIEDKVDKNNYLKYNIIIFIGICILYGNISIGKSNRFRKNYIYFTLLYLFLLLYSIYSIDYSKIIYLVPVFLWIGYLTILSFVDELNYINLFIE